MPNPPGADPDLASTFDRTVEEGHRRLSRTWPGLLATGAVGGIDVGVGVLALAIVVQATGSELLGALAFSIGFIALTLASSELFTEDFLVPIAAVAAGRDSWSDVVRLWVGTLITNLAGGWVMTGIIVIGVPWVRPALVALGTHFFSLGHGTQALAAAVLGGTVITLMTWMQHGTESIMARLVAAAAAAFLLAAGSLNHAIVASLEMFGALQSGAGFGYLDWLGTLGLAVAGNLAGGVGLVTLLRLVQVGRAKIEIEREASEHADAPGLILPGQPEPAASPDGVSGT